MAFHASEQRRSRPSRRQPRYRYRLNRASGTGSVRFDRRGAARGEHRDPDVAQHRSRRWSLRRLATSTLTRHWVCGTVSGDRAVGREGARQRGSAGRRPRRRGACGSFPDTALLRCSLFRGVVRASGRKPVVGPPPLRRAVEPLHRRADTVVHVRGEPARRTSAGQCLVEIRLPARTRSRTSGAER